MEYILIAVLGVCIGSFLNVCIYRIPISKSIIAPRSFCPFCKEPIKWIHNIPLISFLWLRGKCRYCGTPIPVRYFFVELLTALSGIVLFLYFSLSATFFIYWLFACMLIVISFIDLEHQEIPDILSITGIGLGLILMTVSRTGGDGVYLSSFLNSLFGMLVGAGSMLLMGIAGEMIFKKEALGGGDIKLMGMIGAFIGWKFVLLTFFIAPVFGSIAGIIMKVKFDKEIMPYGPYLAIGALVSLLYGQKILEYFFISS